MPYEVELPNGTIVEGIPDDMPRDEVRKRIIAAYPDLAPKPEKESALRQAADVPLNVTKGVVSGVRMLSDVFGADNPISKSLRGVEDYVGDLLSAQAKNDQKEISRIMQEAEDKGVLEQIKAGLNAFTVAPVDLMAQAFGTVIPTLAGGLAGAGLKIGAKAAGTLTGAAMGAGTGKSAIYDAVTEELSKANLPKEVIEQAATKAQEYGGKNLDLILANTLLGGIAGTTGIEKALIPGLSKRITEKAAQRGMLTRAATTGLPEAGTEFLQGGTEQASKNIALQREGYDVPTMRGVYSAGTMEGAAGLGMGAATGALHSPTPTVNPAVEPSVVEQPPAQLAPEPFTPTVIPPAYSTQEGIDRATGVTDGGGYTAADLLTPGAEGVREQAQRMATQDLNAVGTPRAPTDRAAAQQAAFDRAAQELGYVDQRQPMPVSPSQAVPYTAPAPVSIEERRKLADAQSAELAKAQNEPFAFDRRRLEASASTVGGTGQVRGTPRAVLADPNPMVPRAARQRLAVMKEEAAAKGEDPNALVIVPHPTMGGRFAIEKRSMEQPYVAPPIETPTVSQAEAQRRIEESALAGSEQQRLAQDNPRQQMISRAMANIEARGGVASPYEAQLLREANMGRPYNSIDQGIAPESAPLVNESQRQQALEQEHQEQLAASRSGLAGPNLPIQRNVAPTVETPEAIEAERQARNKSDLAQQQRRLLELQQQRLTEQQNREEAGAAKAAKPLEIPSPDAVIGALRTPAPLRSAEESSLVSRAKSLMPAAEFNALQRAGEEDFNILQRAANAPATMSMQDKARLNVIREGRASLASETQVATPEAKALADEVRKKLLPVLKRFGLEKMGLRLVDTINNGGAEGMYFKNVITLALDNENPMGVMRHEVIHALKELGAFTTGEWKVLTDMAKKKWINQFYSPALQAQYKAQYEKDGDTTQTFDEYMAEEAIAQAFRYFTETKPPSGMIANLMRRLNNVFNAIREFFMGNGVTDAEQLFLAKSIFSNIESGRMTAGRAGVQPKAAPAYSLKDTSSLENSFEMARSKNYAKNRDFKIELQAAVLDAAAKEGIDLSSTADEVTKHLIDVGTKDAEFAMKSNANAIGWYDKTVSKALAIISLMHPEIKTSPEAKLAFTWGLAVTSNGIKVDKNFELAEQVYAYYKKHKKMPTNIAAGEATDSINKGLKAFNDLSKKWTPSELRQFMATEMPAGLVSKITGMKVTGENATTNVLGAAILGPKIGNGFFSNLNGIFDQLTMDRWLMRTWGRWTGSLIDSKPEQINKSTETLKNLVDKILNDPVTLANYEPLIKQKITAVDLNDDASVQALAKKIVKASVKPENRTEFNKTPVGEEIRKAANNLEGYLDGQKEAPENGTERTYIREVFTGILDNMRKQGHKDMTMADLQALLWYPERRLYDAGKESDVETGYADDEAPDYANAATKIALKNKVPKTLIETAAKEAEIGYERRAEAARRGNDGSTSDAVGRGVGFAGKARKNFATRGVIQSYLERNPTKPQAFKRKSPKDGESLRVLRQDVIAEYSPEVSFNNALKSVGSESPKFYELTSAGAKTFQTAIQNAKNNNAFGAAVTVYPEEDYAKMRLFVSKDGKAGFALKGDDIVSVFSQPPHSGGVNGIMQLATQLGGRRLDAFDTILPDLYFNNGFTVVARMKWNNEYIPEGWSKQRFQEFNNGEPDVVFMAYDPKVKERPTNKQGVYIDDYDASVALQQKQSKGKKYGKYSLKPEQLALRPSDSSGGGISFNDRKEDATSYAGSHYGKTKTNILSGGYYGTGLRGAEAKRLAQAKDHRIGKRVYFYIPRANGTMPMRESGVGNHVYTQKFDNILGPGKTMSELYKKAQGDSNAFESFVIDNGYDGYAVPDYGMMVVLNNDIEAKYEGTVGEVHYNKVEGKASFRADEKGIRFAKALGSLEPATFLVPDTSLNNTGNLGMMPDARDIEGKPIRLAVGLEDAITSKGYGATHILKRIEKDTTRKPPVVSKELLEDLVRNVEKTAQSFTRLYRDRNNLIAYNPITTESLILAERPDHYSVITSYRQNNMGKYGNIVWTGKTPTDTKKYQTKEEPQKGIPVKAGASGVVRQPVATTFKQRKVMSPEAIQEMADDLARAKLQGKASLRTPPALLKQTLTDSFKRWFGKSAIVDMNGDPKVMYHGTARDIYEFRGKQAGAIFVTDKPNFAEDFTGLSENFMVKESFNGMPKNEKVALLKKALKLAEKDEKLSQNEITYVQGYIKDSADSTFGLIPSAIEEEIIQLLKDSLPSRANILPVFVRAENPFDFQNPDHIDRIVAESKKINGNDEYRGGSYVAQITNAIKSGAWEEIESKPVQDAIKAAGFDGFYMKENGVKNLAVYEPNQLKSAIGNTGAFSRESNDIRYSLTNNVPPAVHTKLAPNQTAGQQVTAAATNAMKTIQKDGFFTGLRNGFVDDTSGLGHTLASKGMSKFADNKLRADMLRHAQSNSINLINIGLQSGVPVLNSDGSIIIEKTESNMARSIILADKLDSNPYVKASKLKGGRGFVAEVARALRGADIKQEDAAMIAEGQQKIADADALETSLNAAVKAGGQDVKTIASAKNMIDKLRKEGKELVATKRELQVDDAQIQWAEAQLKNVPELKEIFGIWKDINDALTDLSEDTGVISKEQAQKYRDKKFYVPLFKAREDLAETFFHGSSAKNVAKSYKLEGADIDRNIWENLQKQYAMTIAVAYENQTRKVATEQLQGFGLAKTVDNPNDPNINLRYKDDGKIVNVIAENPSDIAAFQMMNYELGPIMKAISATTKVLRFGALVNPMFWIKQLIRDPIHASLTSSQVVTPFHSAIAFAKVLNKSSESAKILEKYGVIGAVDSTVDLKEYIGQLGKEKKTPQMLSSAMHKIMQMHEASDAATRVAIFDSAKKEALKKGMSEEEAINFAVYRARESINFGVRGNSKALNTLRHSIPFFQAAITSLDTVYRAATGYGLPPAERKKAQLIFAKRAAVMALMSTMYAMMYTDDDEYKDLPDYVKDGNWLFPTTTPDGRKTFVKIPVPFEIGFLFKTIPEAAWRAYVGTSTGKEVGKSYLEGLIHNLPGGGILIPQAFKPALEAITNHSFFTGNPIEGMSDQGKPVVERGRNASEFAKAASQAGLHNVGLSPAKIDALIKGYFAELGGTFLMASSNLMDSANGVERPSKNIESMPVFKAFMTDPNVSKAVSDFYTLEHNAKEMTNMFASLKKEGLFDRAREYITDEEKRGQMAAAPVFRKIGEQLGKIKTEIKRIENREGMTADEKQTRINELQKMLAQTARRGYDVAERAGIAR